MPPPARTTPTPANRTSGRRGRTWRTPTAPWATGEAAAARPTGVSHAPHPVGLHAPGIGPRPGHPGNDGGAGVSVGGGHVRRLPPDGRRRPGAGGVGGGAVARDGRGPAL